MQQLVHQSIRQLEVHHLLMIELYINFVAICKVWCYIILRYSWYFVPFRYLSRTWDCAADWELCTDSTAIRAFDCNSTIYKVLSTIVCMAIVKLAIFDGLEAGFNTLMFTFQSYLIRLGLWVFWMTNICLETSKFFCSHIRTAQRFMKII